MGLKKLDIRKPYISEPSSMVSVMEKVSSNTKQAVNTKDIGTEILETEKVLKDTPMEILISDSSNTEKLMERVSIHGKTAKYTMVSGTKA
jgi:hypothetical protein